MTLRNEPHDGYEPPNEAGPPVIVRFKSSSQPKGQDGYEVALTSAATKDQVTETVLLAAIAREQMQLILGGATVAQLREAGALEAELATLHQAELVAAGQAFEEPDNVLSLETRIANAAVATPAWAGAHSDSLGR